MSQQTRMQKIGATPGKLALVGVLAAVLAVVIVGQLPEGADHPLSDGQVSDGQVSDVQANNGQRANEDSRAAALPAKSHRPTSAARLAAASPAVTAVDSNQPETKPWPEISLLETLAHDPFALPAWVIQQERETIAASQEPDRLAELQKQGASIVVIAGRHKSATIGEQQVRVGDILAGYQVADITEQGILVDKLDASERRGFPSR